MDTPAVSSLIPFLLRAKRNTYAATDNADQLAAASRPSSRPASHDLAYQEGDLFYLDTYLGGFAFVGEEAIWQADKPVWGMNYYGTMLIDHIPDGFGEFLKLALREVPADKPYRGPTYFADGRFEYGCQCEGDMTRFKGEERIALDGEPIYSLDFHGGTIV